MFKIYVTNPTRQALNLLGVDNVFIELDIADPDALRLTKEVERLNTDGTINVEGAMNLSLPYTRINNAALMEFYPDVIDQRYKYLNVRIMAENMPVNFNRLYVIARNENDKRNYWEVELRRPLDHWVELAAEKKLNTIDCGEFVFNETNIRASWEVEAYPGTYDPADNDAAIFPPIDYGGWVDLTLPGEGFPNIHYKTLISADIRPLISLPYLLKQGFCEIGYEIKGTIFDSAFLKHAWIYILSQEYYSQSSFGILAGSRYDEFEIFPVTQNLQFSEKTQGDTSLEIPASALFNCGVVIPFPPEVIVSYRFFFAAPIFNDTAQEIEVYFWVHTTSNTDINFPDGEVISNQQKATIAAGATQTVAVDITFQAPGGTKCVLIVSPNSGLGVFIKPGLTFKAENVTQSFVEGDNIIIKDCINPDYTLLDLLKGTIHLINGATDTDLTVKSLEITPENDSTAYGDTIPGFIIQGQVFDISDRVIEGSIKDTPQRAELNRYTRIQFKDSTDAWIDQNKQYEAEPAHSRKIANGDDLPDEITEFPNPFFEPTIDGQDFRLKGPFDNRTKPPMLPRMWDNSSGARSFNIGPRILWNYGERTQLNPNASESVDDITGFMFNSNGEAGVLTFGYVSQAREWELLNYGVDGNFVFGTKPTDLFNLFYLGFFQQQQYSRMNNLLMQMNTAEYSAFKFRALYYYVDNGRSVYAKMRKISDFIAGSQITTPVDFQRSPALSACCDLPCGCRFSECEYYQDLGPQVRQSTLDTLKIASFKVDGKELVTSDVSLGLKNVIVVNSRQYLTNLVDALNTIAAPYFIFSYSTRVSTAKGLRFFKIKRPACQSFEIVIEQSGDPVYRYTELVQEQKWFGASFEPFSYGAEEYSEPENCVNTIEF